MIIGGLIQVYVIIIGGQAYPLVLFPGMEVASSFQDGVVATYVPSLYEILLGVGGIGLSLLVVVLGPLMLRFLPISLADERVDPHYKAAAES